MYFKDFSTYKGAPETRVQHVGWLGKRQLFERGKTPATFITALRYLCLNHAIWKCAGHHACEICANASWDDPYYFRMGNGEIWVRAEAGTWYVAPTLVTHYVETHRYLPPPVFIDAVMHPREIGVGPTSVLCAEDMDVPKLEVGPFTPNPSALDVAGPVPFDIPREPWWRRILGRSI